jgi:hypothetical protein
MEKEEGKIHRYNNNNNSILIYLRANSTAQGPITK